MTRLRDVAVIFASSVALAQDPQQVLNGGSRLLTTPLGTQVNTLGSCLMGSACQRVGKKITIDDIVISTDGQGNTKCCPLGTTFNGSRCVYPKSTVCPPNMHFANGVCVLTSGPVCEDTNLVPTKDGCASKVPPRCPPETILDNGQCVMKEDPTCPGGKKIVNGLCTVDEVPKCPEKGFRAQGNLCVSDEGPTCHQDWLKVVDGKCVHTKEASCPPGTKQSGTGRCISVQPPSCPPGFTVSGNTCLHDTGPSCPSGSTFRNGVCEYSRLPSCSEGTLTNGVCVSSSQPGCPSGFKFDKVTARCLRRDQLNCQAGYVNRWDRVSDKVACCPKDFGGFDGTFCTQDNPGSNACPVNSELRDGKCVTSPGGQPDCDGGKGFVEKGVCYKKEEASCPTPLKVFKDKCVYETDPHCTDGKLSPSRMECIVEGPNCPNDSTVVDDECVSNVHIPECPSNLKRKDGSCVGEPTLSCPPGSVKNGDYCIYDNVQPACKDGLLLLGNQCVTRTTAKCPEDTMPEGEYCVSMKNPICPEPEYIYSLARRACIYKYRPSCLPPFYLKNESPECPDQSTELDEKTGQCISRSETPKCTDGSVLTNGKCVVRADCPPNTTPMGDYCVSYQKPACRDGFTLENGECVLKKGPACPPGFAARGTECFSTKQPVCPTGSIQDGDRCIIGVNPDCIILGTCPEIA
ncbi:hypothetical protein FGSG_02876 [Fusarium graminearum PH-1]|uniref:hypothetical protein n=1 Tax=Gibberella zeae (strain ATCC MYA-4620 / CBS 123657 / FGSC 9075 / NRRL 31084 / PH-1) TaxID=229533 RepID=UPI00021F17ED|nr:hypothetical protein FGSG_02876 [Fusarium graminearum PH-1]ESU10431.1 hypothetical protein FGSG_02876 [Fusarium graminearum PH-1]|eukprot:XP_011322930.1 hypothetical protein FGSG_02876 [Fusarium graminearum PH-1]